MKYILIKKCRIVGYQEKNLDILIANEKIVSIGKNLSRPVIDCEEVDADGRIAIPGLVDICSCFNSIGQNDVLSKTLYDDIRAGFTTWMGTVAPSNAIERLDVLSHQDPKTLNYGFHFNVNEFHHGDLNKIRLMAENCGIASMLYSLVTPKAATNDRLDLYLATVAKNNMLIIFDIQRECDSSEHIDALKRLCRRIDGVGCRVLFTNVRYLEEFEVIRRERNSNETYVNVNYCPVSSGNSGMHPIESGQFVSLLRQYPWVTGDIVSPPADSNASGSSVSAIEESTRKYRVSMLGAMCQAENFTTEEIVEYMSVRKCKFVGLWPEKGRIQVGADADICLLNDNVKSIVKLRSSSSQTSVELHNSIETVIMSGRVVYDNNEVKLANVVGRSVFGRFV